MYESYSCLSSGLKFSGPFSVIIASLNRSLFGSCTFSSVLGVGSLSVASLSVCTAFVDSPVASVSAALVSSFGVLSPDYSGTTGRLSSGYGSICSCTFCSWTFCGFKASKEPSIQSCSVISLVSLATRILSKSMERRSLISFHFLETSRAVLDYFSGIRATEFGLFGSGLESFDSCSRFKNKV